jgi:uncharacterized protein (TIGR00297 family)
MHLIPFDLMQIEPGWWGATVTRVGAILALTVVFAALGHLVRGVSRSGAIAGGLVCFALLVSVGPSAFAGLLVVFAVTWAATRWGRSRKQILGTAERREGRTATQVLANTGMAAACALCYSAMDEPLMLIGMAAALAEAAADTVSSEFGQAYSRHAYLVTTFERVPAGTDGGITVGGSLAGAGAALLVSAACMLAGLFPARWMWIATAAGVLGMLVDSFLGALFERRKWVGNDTVNLTSTVFAAVVAAVAASW